MPRDRKSLDEHDLQGTKPQYVLPDSEVAAGRPKYPHGISGEAKSAFKRLVKMLQQRNCCTNGDQEILRLYAYLFDRHTRALEHIATEGEIVSVECETKKGDLYTVRKPNPYLKIAEVCESKMAAILTQLGLTPRTRTQVKETKSVQKPEETLPTRTEAMAAAENDGDLLASIDEQTAVQQ
jgi:P27 family predicted phage terminase small subunit